MTRLASLVVFASILACVLAQTSTEPPVTTESPTQEPQGHNNYSFASNNNVCIRLTASLVLNITYANSSGGNEFHSFKLDNITHLAEQNSSCGDKDQAIGLFFALFGDEEVDSQFITFKFHKGDSNEWNVSDVLYSFKPSTFPEDLELPPNIPENMTITLKATDRLMDTSYTNIDLGSYYKCSTEKDLSFDSTVVDKKINATLGVTELQVQPFIEEKSNGQFGSVRDCNASKGNKIVPIAVGAALAGLVIVVLIAYLIGRLKSRRQSSYEALS